MTATISPSVPYGLVEHPSVPLIVLPERYTFAPAGSLAREPWLVTEESTKAMPANLSVPPAGAAASTYTADALSSANARMAAVAGDSLCILQPPKNPKLRSLLSTFRAKRTAKRQLRGRL